MTRVQIPAYTDRFMMGDQYGTVIRITIQRKTRQSIIRERHFVAGREIAHVKLDKSGRTMKFVYADCTVVD